MSESSVFKDDLFEGKKVFITGGATGMGLGFAQAFLNHGAKVIIASRKKDKLEEAAEITKQKFGKELHKKCVVFTSNKLYDNEIPEWIIKYVNEKGFQIENNATIILSEHLGSELSKITNGLITKHDF